VKIPRFHQDSKEATLSEYSVKIARFHQNIKEAFLTKQQKNPPNTQNLFTN
jgi:hypothetical protein